MKDEKVWYEFQANKPGTIAEMIELPVRSITPQGASEVLRMLLENRPNDVIEYHVIVRKDMT